MLTALVQSTQQKVTAWEADRGDQPFLCFCCRRVVTLRRGGSRSPHFAHKPPVTCEYGRGESEIHRHCKLELYEHLIKHPRVSRCELERDLGTIRPDISAYIGGVPVAIEVQVSNLSLAKISYRTAEYARKGIYLLWLPLYNRSMQQEYYNPHPWEWWLHGLYYGRVYYWLTGARVLPIHFRDYYVKVRGRTRDYEKLSLRKVPLEGQSVLLTEEFRPVTRKEWRSGRMTYPAAKLLLDTQPRWYWLDETQWKQQHNRGQRLEVRG